MSRATVAALAASAVLALGAGSAPLAATTIVLGTDAELADQAEAIVVATVLDSVPAPDRAATDHRLDVERTLKGRVPHGELVLRQLGGPDPGGSGMTLVVWGNPDLVPGDRVLVFLTEDGEGWWTALGLAAGVFHAQPAGATKAAVRDLGEVHAIRAAVEVEPGRDFARFADWLHDRAAGIERAPDYLLPTTPALAAPAKFSYTGGVKRKWTDFAAGKTAIFRTHTAGQPGIPGGGVAEAVAAANVWTNDANTLILYKVEGTTGSTSGLSTYDALNTFTYEDPNRLVPGNVTCSSPGVVSGHAVLALGGGWTLNNAPTVLRAGDVVTNEGLGCWVNGVAARLVELFTHELGHTLGLGHSCGDTATGPCDTPPKDDAIMRSSAHDDGRGGRLGDDDRAGILSLYPLPALGPPGNLQGTALSGTQVRLTWNDNAAAETGFNVQMKQGKKWVTVGTVGANVKQATIGNLKPKTSYSFRVAAKGAGTQVSAPSNVATVKTL